MDDFLQALTPSLREEVEGAVGVLGQSALEQVLVQYIDEDGNWPTNPETAAFLANQFMESTAPMASVPDRTQREYGGSGLAETTVAALAGGAVSIGAAKGAVVLSSRLMSRYSNEIIGYATGLNPAMSRALGNVFRYMTANTHWDHLARDLQRGTSSYDLLFGNRFQKMIEREVLGVLSRAAWRGARSAVNHTGTRVTTPSETVPWIQNYVATFAANQKTLTERTIKDVLNRGIERGLSDRVLGTEFRDLWRLTPRHAQAVENYRRGLQQQDRTVASVRRMTRSYADRLARSRVEAMSRTEVLTAFNLGRELEWQKAVQSGDLPLGTVKMWVTAQDELVCKICRPLDGETTALGEAFQSDEVTLYTPTAHPNCRCITIPVRQPDFTSESQDPELIFDTDEVSKRTITVSEYTRSDGTVVEEHQRKITAAATAGLVLAGGIALFTRGRVRGYQFTRADTVTRLPFDDAMTLLRSRDARTQAREFMRLSDDARYSAVASSLRETGQIPSWMKARWAPARHVEADIRLWKNSQQRFLRESMMEGRTRGRDLSRVIAAGSDAPPLYRGAAIDANIARNIRRGETVTLGPSGFSTIEDVARQFASPGGTNQTAVLFRVRDARGVRLERGTAGGTEAEWITSGRFRVTNVSEQDLYSYRRMIVDLEQTDVMVPNSYIRVGKRVIQVEAYERSDGTSVEAHERRLGSSSLINMDQLSDFLSNFERDGELSAHEMTALGAVGALGLAFASRGRIRRRVTPSVYRDFQRTPDGFVPSDALRRSLDETFTFNGTQFSTRISNVRIGDQPHHTVTFQLLETASLYLGNNRAGRAFQRTFQRRDNIRVNGDVLNRDGIPVGEFDVAIDPRRREAFQYGFFLNPGVQGRGFSGEFTAHLGRRYLDTGIERVGASAGSSVGGYAWAQRGFNWRYGPSLSVHRSLSDAARGRHHVLGPNFQYTSPEVVREIRQMERRLARGHITRRFPTPQEIANIGRDRPFVNPVTGRETWAGREIMLGTDWHASMDLNQIRRLLRQDGFVKSYNWALVSETHDDTSGITHHDDKELMGV